MMTNTKTLLLCGNRTMCMTTIHRADQEPVTLTLPALQTPTEEPWTLGMDASDADGAEFDCEAWATGCRCIVLVRDWGFLWSDLNVHSIPGDCNPPVVAKGPNEATTP